LTLPDYQFFMNRISRMSRCFMVFPLFKTHAELYG